MFYVEHCGGEFSLVTESSIVSEWVELVERVETTERAILSECSTNIKSFADRYLLLKSDIRSDIIRGSSEEHLNRFGRLPMGE